MTNIGVRAAVLVATVLVGVSWWPLTTSHGWFLSAVGIIAAGAGAGMAASALTKRTWVGSLLAGVVAAGMLGLTLTPGTLAVGVVPTPDSFAEFGRLWQLGMHQANAVTAPVITDRAMRAVLVSSLVLLWWIADLLGVASAYPGAAALSLLAIFAVPASVLQSGLPAGYFVIAATGLCVLLLSGAAEYLQDWGARVDTGTAWPQWSALATAAAAVALAVALPTALPGLSSGLVQKLRGSDAAGSLGGGSAALSPDLDLRRDLTRSTDRPLLRFTTEAPTAQPLRMFTVDSFDSDTWRAVSSQPSQRNDGGLLVLEPQLPPDPVRTSVRVQGLRQRALPYPAPATTIAISGSWAYDPVTATVRGGKPTDPDLRYEVTHSLPDPGAVADTDVTGVDPRWLAVPDSVVQLKQQAREIAGDGPALAQSQRLQAFFRVDGDFSYTLDVPQQTGPSAIEDFLQRRSGYCVHYATAMTLMARSLGIPARVAVGTLPGEVVDTVQGQQVWEASEKDAHAWPELYFAGAGWVRFEPTPSARTGTAPPWTTEQSNSTATASAAPEAVAAATPDGQQRPDEQDAGVPESDASGDASAPWVPVAVALLLLALAAATPGLVTASRRRRRWAEARTDSEVAEAAWAELTQQLADLGVSWPASATVRGTEQVVGDVVAGAAAKEALARRSAAVSRARYGAPVMVGAGPRDAEASRDGFDRQGQDRPVPNGHGSPKRGAIDDVRVIVADAAGQRDWRTRARARCWPSWRKR